MGKYVDTKYMDNLRYYTTFLSKTAMDYGRKAYLKHKKRAFQARKKELTLNDYACHT